MTGYMNEIIFSRVLGHDEIEEGTFWCDTVQCWVCGKWDKVVFKHDPDDREVFRQKIDKVKKFQDKIGVLVGRGMERERERLKKENALMDEDIESNIDINADKSEDSFIEEVPEELEGTHAGGFMLTENVRKTSEVDPPQISHNLPGRQTSSGHQQNQGQTVNTSSKNVKSSSGLQGETARKTSSGNQQGETRNVTISGKSIAKSGDD